MFCPLSFLEKKRVGPLFPIVEKNKKDLTLQGLFGTSVSVGITGDNTLEYLVNYCCHSIPTKPHPQSTR
jgi:hypothetical protein